MELPELVVHKRISRVRIILVFILRIVHHFEKVYHHEFKLLVYLRNKHGAEHLMIVRLCAV